MLAISSLLSIVQNLCNAGALFVLYRLLISTVGSSDLGVWSIVVASTAAVKISDLGFSGGVVGYVSKYLALRKVSDAVACIETSILTIGAVVGFLGVIFYPVSLVFLPYFIKGEANIALAIALVPFALINLWLGSLFGCVQSGLDGCNKIHERNILSISSNFILLIFVVALVPRYGVIGAAISQIIQSIFLLLIGWTLLRRHIPLSIIPVHLRFDKFKEMLGFSLGFQLNSLLGLFFDPLAKLLLSKFGDLPSVAYYEMSSQVVSKVRGLFISANQVVSPTVATLSISKPQGLRSFYINSFGMNSFFLGPIFCVLISLFYFISLLLLGYFEPVFCYFGVVLCLGWYVNSFNIPAYFFYLGLGRMRWNVLSQFVTSFLCLILSFTLGFFFDARGVIFGVSIALFLGSWISLVAFHFEYDIPWNVVFPKSIIFINVWIFGIFFVSLFLRANRDFDGLYENGFLFSVNFFVVILWLVLNERFAILAEKLKKIWIGFGRE